MKKIFVGILMVIVMVGFGIISEAKNIGKVIKKENYHSDDIQIQNWIGQKFMFLEKHKSLQSYGYQRLSFSSKKLYSKHPTYDKWVGKIITVESITPDRSCFLIKFDYKGKKIYAKPCGNNIDGIILLQDLENAKERWMGKTIYSKKGLIRTYDEDGGKREVEGKINVFINEPLKVIDVISTMIGCNKTCIWVVVKTSKQEVGFIGVAYSYTNYYISRYIGGKYSEERPWQKDITEFNPQEKFGWSDEICQTISEKKISLGMTKLQIIWSWGKPESINRGIYKEGKSSEQWVYGSGSYVYFNDGVDKVTAIQN